MVKLLACLTFGPLDKTYYKEVDHWKQANKELLIVEVVQINTSVFFQACLAYPRRKPVTVLFIVFLGVMVKSNR